MSTNLGYRERERQRKMENRRQASEGQREKEQWRANLVPREKRPGDEVDGGQKKLNKNMYDISSINV